MATNTHKPYTQTTITGVINTTKTLGISEGSMAFKTVLDMGSDRVAVTFYNVITKYHRVLKNYIDTITLSDDDYIRFKNQPGYFCYIYYGTPELASSLLYINNMVSSTEFTRKTIKKFKSNILDVLNELMTLTEKDLLKNRVTNNIE